MKRRFKITYHPKAGGDFDLIDEFIAKYAGNDVAVRIIDKMKATISKLQDLPHKGSLRNDIVRGLRAIPSAEKAVICFTVNDETRTVKIVCVTYAGQDWQTIAMERENPSRS